jgi:hypothetical protein
MANLPLNTEQCLYKNTIKSVFVPIIVLTPPVLQGYPYHRTTEQSADGEQGRSEGRYWGVVNPPPTFLELTYSENRVGHSENYGNNSITQF